MNKAETATLLQTLIVMFPTTKLTADELTVTVWQEMLADLPAELAMNAARRVCSGKNFPATIAEIRAAVAEAIRESEGTVSPGEAWAKVRKAISVYGYYRPEKAREALGEEIWRAVEMIGGWNELCMSEAGGGVLSAQFERRYEAARQKKREELMIPGRLREEMKRLAGEKLLLSSREQNAAG